MTTYVHIRPCVCVFDFRTTDSLDLYVCIYVCVYFCASLSKLVCVSCVSMTGSALLITHRLISSCEGKCVLIVFTCLYVNYCAYTCFLCIVLVWAKIYVHKTIMIPYNLKKKLLNFTLHGKIPSLHFSAWKTLEQETPSLKTSVCACVCLCVCVFVHVDVHACGCVSTSGRVLRVKAN